MTLFKCKMCGGDLEIIEGATTAECEYCGTKQTVPKAMDENLQNLFNRANTLRIKSEFDKAEKLYEKIIEADAKQSEAYWGLILCKYGIEYVDDPATYKKIPTCHRASYASIIADDDYKSALEHADMSQRAIYEEQAKEIDRIQKDILALAQNEEAYDVFICYKETDADGRRTQDSVIANDIYYQLTNEGYKVFYAAITLEGKLGSAYEPIIFAALNSAKVMLAIGTKPEYFNAVWVKNEWSRFLKIIKNDRAKLLIPCYRDMDAYELPEEFAHLQAQDMSKIGFINDIVRGIQKVIVKEEPKEPTIVKETVVTSTAGSANTEALLKRAFMFLEDGEWDRADDFCEQVLNQDPENEQAYLGKLMAELHVKKQDSLKDQAKPFDDRNNYRKVIRFADEKLKATLRGYIEYIITRNENTRLDGIYTRAKNAMSAARTESAYKEAAQLFASISGYLDADTLAQKCKDACKENENKRLNGIYNSTKNAMSTAISEKDYRAVAQRFSSISGYLDSAALAKECYEKAEAARKDAILVDGKSKMVGDEIERYETAIKVFKSIPGWKDADEQILVCHEKIDELIAYAVEERKKRKQQAENERLEIERQAELARLEAERISKKKKLKFTVIVAAVCAIIAAVFLVNSVIIPNGKYNDAIALMEAGEYNKAITAFKELEGYKNSGSKIKECNRLITDEKYDNANALFDAGYYEDALTAFKALNGYRDSSDKIEECNSLIIDSKYNSAVAMYDAGNFVEARELFVSLDGYKDSIVKIDDCNAAILESKYNDAISLMNSGNIVKAYEALIGLDGYKDSAKKAKSIFNQYKDYKWKNAKVGDYVFFGTYEQDNNTSNGKEDIEWLVLEVKDGKALVISKYALDCIPYGDSVFSRSIWENCFLRKWLNNTFMNSAFSESDKKMIQITTVSADKNPNYNTDPGETTEDYVFILSIAEAKEYLSSGEKGCKTTDYAIGNGASVFSDGGCIYWWLRSPGQDKNFAATVSGGSVNDFGTYVSNDCVAVRPAMWIDLNS